jgi:hypothetical protein
MPVEGGNVDRSATRLAVESVELIRASLAGLWPSPPVPRAPETFTREPPPGPGVAVALSVGRMTDLGDAPAFWAPQLAASWGRPDGFGVRLTASGLGPGADVSTEAGSVHIARAVATLGLVRSFRTDRTIQPTFGIAGGGARGARHVAAATSPRCERVLGLGMVWDRRGLGARVAPSPGGRDDRLAGVEVRIAGADVAIFDGPSLFAPGPARDVLTG